MLCDSFSAYGRNCILEMAKDKWHNMHYQKKVGDYQKKMAQLATPYV